MRELFKIHVDFIRRPSYALEQYIRVWPNKLTSWMLLFGIFSLSLGSPKLLVASVDMLVAISDDAPLKGLPAVYALMILSGLFSFWITWHILPRVVRYFSAASAETFDIDLCRRLLCYSWFPGIFVSICVTLPWEIISSLFLTNWLQQAGDTAGGNIFKALLPLLLFLLIGLPLAFWAIVAGIAKLILDWKGLKRFFNLEGWQVFFTIVIVPLVVSAPFWIIPLLYMIQMFKHLPAR